MNIEIITIAWPTESSVMTGVLRVLAGCWRVLDFDYLSRVLQSILSAWDEAGWEGDRLPLSTCCQLLSDLYPRYGLPPGHRALPQVRPTPRAQSSTPGTARPRGTELHPRYGQPLWSTELHPRYGLPPGHRALPQVRPAPGAQSSTPGTASPSGAQSSTPGTACPRGTELYPRIGLHPWGTDLYPRYGPPPGHIPLPQVWPAPSGRRALPQVRPVPQGHRAPPQVHHTPGAQSSTPGTPHEYHTPFTAYCKTYLNTKYQETL